MEKSKRKETNPSTVLFIKQSLRCQSRPVPSHLPGVQLQDTKATSPVKDIFPLTIDGFTLQILRKSNRILQCSLICQRQEAREGLGLWIWPPSLTLISHRKFESRLEITLTFLSMLKKMEICWESTVGKQYNTQSICVYAVLILGIHHDELFHFSVNGYLT